MKLKGNKYNIILHWQIKLKINKFVRDMESKWQIMKKEWINQKLMLIKMVRKFLIQKLLDSKTQEWDNK